MTGNPVSNMGRIILLLLSTVVLAGCGAAGDSDKKLATPTTPIMEVDGLSISQAEYETSLDQVNGIITELEATDGNPEFLAMMKGYGPELIAFASLISNNAEYAEALRRGLAASEAEVEQMVDRVRQEQPERLMARQEFVVSHFGEEYYWQTYLPDMFAKSLARNDLRNQVIVERGSDGWNSFRWELLERVNVEIVDSDLLTGVSKEDAVQYLKQGMPAD